MLRLAFVVAALLATGSAGAQPTRSALRAGVPAPASLVGDIPAGVIDVAADESADTARARPTRFWTRTALGVGGSLVGIVAGGIVGQAVLPPTQCGDDPGLCEVAKGAFLGGIVGGALAASLPGLGSRCTGNRLGVGLLGATTGALVGLFGVGGSSAVLLTFPLGAGVGAGAGAAIGADAC